MSDILPEEKSTADEGDEPYECILEMASDMITKSEALKQQESAISRFELTI